MIALSLMANGRGGKALEILLELVGMETLATMQDVFLCDISLCLQLNGRSEEAMGYSIIAVDAASRVSGENSLQMAT